MYVKTDIDYPNSGKFKHIEKEFFEYMEGNE